MTRFGTLVPAMPATLDGIAPSSEVRFLVDTVLSVH